MPAMTQPVRYRFSSFELQLDERRLLDAGAPVTIGPRAFDLLVALVERAGHLVTKDELLERVWPKVIVEEAALQMQISTLRKAIGRAAIATVTARGYRFMLEVARVSPDEIAATSAPAHNLPQPVSSFVGRAKQILELKALLHRTRLLTLTGSGGCGKTRLAMHTAAELVGQFPDGIWLVELAALTDARLIPDAVARVLGLNVLSGKEPLQVIAHHLTSRRPLMVLDNAEHLVEACARFTGFVLSACPHLRVLVTSRERLGIDGELTYRVPSLSVPGLEQQDAPERVLQYESARLFIQRAQLQQPEFTVTPANVAALASICRRLDGIPLAIELAAARARMMPLDEVHRRLDQRFDLLTEGSRTSLPRHRTLRSLIDWSYDLLSGAEQDLLCRASIFCGGWTLEAAESVCAGNGIEAKEMLNLLTSLTDKSLVTAREVRGETRYELLETVRHYARERLSGQDEEARFSRLHFECMLALADKAYDRVTSSDQQDWLDRLEVEHMNLRSALSWASANPECTVDGLRLASSLGWFWSVRGHHGEGRRWLAMLIAAVPGGPPDSIRAYALRGAANLAAEDGDYVGAEQQYGEALAIFRRLGDKKGMSHVLNNMAVMAIDRQDYGAALPLLEESMEVRVALGDQHGVGLVLGNLGLVALDLGSPGEARSLMERGLAILRKLGSQRAIAIQLMDLGGVLREEGDHLAAREKLKEALAIFRQLSDRPMTASCLEEFAALAAATAQPARAAALWGRTQRLREEIMFPHSDRSRVLLEQQVRSAREALGDDAAFESAWKAERDKPLEQVTNDLLEP